MELFSIQIAPFGDWDNGATKQICDKLAFEQLVNDWRQHGERDILCDFEHRAEEPSSTSDTTAAGWFTNLRIDDERGLVGDLRLTDLGQEALVKQHLRLLSPAWTLAPDGRPNRLKSVALTNKPNIPVAYVLNREPIQVPTNVEDSKDKAMETLKEALGLAPDASDEDVLAAVKGLQEQVAALNKEKAEAAAEAFAEQHKALCNKDALKKAYLLNKEAAIGMVAGICNQPTPQKVLANKDTASPVIPNKSATGDLKADMAALPPSERAAFFKAHKSEF